MERNSRANVLRIRCIHFRTKLDSMDNSGGGGSGGGSSELSLLALPRDIVAYCVASFLSLDSVSAFVRTCKAIHSSSVAIFTSAIESATQNASLTELWRFFKPVLRKGRSMPAWMHDLFCATVVPRFEPLMGSDWRRTMHVDTLCLMMRGAKSALFAHFLFVDILSDDQYYYDMLRHYVIPAGALPPDMTDSLAWDTIENEAYTQYRVSRVRLAQVYRQRIEKEMYLYEAAMAICALMPSCVYAIVSDVMIRKYGHDLPHLPSNDIISCTQLMSMQRIAEGKTETETKAENRLWRMAWERRLLYDLRHGRHERREHFCLCRQPRPIPVVYQCVAHLLNVDSTVMVPNLRDEFPRNVDARSLNFLRTLDGRASANEIAAACLAYEQAADSSRGPGRAAAADAAAIDSGSDDCCSRLAKVWHTRNDTELFNVLFTFRALRAYACERYIPALFELLLRVIDSDDTETVDVPVVTLHRYATPDYVAAIEQIVSWCERSRPESKVHNYLVREAIYFDSEIARILSLPEALLGRFMQCVFQSQPTSAQRCMTMLRNSYVSQAFDEQYARQSWEVIPDKHAKNDTRERKRRRSFAMTSAGVQLKDLLSQYNQHPEIFAWYVCYQAWRSPQCAQEIAETSDANDVKTLDSIWETVQTQLRLHVYTNECSVSMSRHLYVSDTHSDGLNIAFVTAVAFQRAYHEMCMARRINPYAQVNTIPVWANAECSLYSERMTAQLAYIQRGIIQEPYTCLLPTPTNMLAMLRDNEYYRRSELLCYSDLARTATAESAASTSMYINSVVYANDFETWNLLPDNRRLIPYLSCICTAWDNVRSPLLLLRMVESVLVPAVADAAYQDIPGGRKARRLVRFLQTLGSVRCLRVEGRRQDDATIQKLMCDASIAWFFKRFVLRYNKDEVIVFMSRFADVFAPIPRCHGRVCGVYELMKARVLLDYYWPKKSVRAAIRAAKDQVLTAAAAAAAAKAAAARTETETETETETDL